MKRFMIVDDSAIVRRTIKNQLQQLNKEIVFEASDGQSAIEYYKDNSSSVDVITLDISMPVLNGLDTLKEIIKIDPDAIVFMITSHGEESMIMDAIEYGAKGYILKPLTEEKLLKLFEEVLQK